MTRIDNRIETAWLIALAMLLVIRATDVAAQTTSVDVTEVIGSLSHHDPDVRVAAANRALVLLDPKLRDALARALSDRDSTVRQRAAVALIRIPGDETRNVVLRNLAHADPVVRGAMYYHFLLQPNVPASLLDKLAKGLDDSDDTARVRAAAAIRKIKGDAPRAVMVRLAGHKDSPVRTQALGWLREHPTPDVADLLAKHVDDTDETARLHAIAGLRSLATKDVADEMLKALKHTDAAVRQQAVLYFVSAPDPRANGLLIAALKDIDNNARTYAARAVEKMDRSDARSAFAAFRKLENQRVDAAALLKNVTMPVDLQKLLLHRDAAVRYKAAMALRYMRGEDAMRAAMAGMKHADARVRANLAYRMHELPNPDATDALKELLDDPNSTVRHHAAMALSVTPGEPAAKVCVAALEHSDPAVRARALYRIYLRPTEADAAVLPKVVAALDDIHASARAHAARALWKLPGEAASKAALAALTHHDPAVRSHVTLRFADQPDASVLPALIKGLSDIDSTVRLHAARAIRKTPGDDAQIAAITAFKHPDSKVREQAVYRFVELPNAAVSETLAKMLNDPMRQVRIHTMSALAHSGDARAVKHLYTTIDDDDQEVRLHAGRVIKMLLQRFPASAVSTSDSPLSPAEAAELLRPIPPSEIERPVAYVEMYGGDRIAGKVISYVGRQQGSQAARLPHVLFEPTSASVVPINDSSSSSSGHARIVANWIRRVVWQRRGGTVHYQPATVLLRGGGRTEYRSLKWSEHGVMLLTSDGIETIDFDDIAELHLPAADAWQAWYEQLAMAGVKPADQLLRVGSVDGSVITIPQHRFRTFLYTESTDPRNWGHGFQPPWCLDVLSIPQPTVWLRSVAPATDVPLFPPSGYEPRTNVLYDWQTDNSVLRSGLVTANRPFRWGFGVHADNVLQFPVPAAAIGFQTHVGLDKSVGNGGCARGVVRTRHKDQSTVVFKSPLLIGSDKVHTTGKLAIASVESPALLELVADSAHADRPPGADPFHIRDMVNWSQPRFLLDPARMQASITTHTRQVIRDLTGWDVKEMRGGTTEIANPWWSDNRNKFQPVLVVKNTPVTLIRTIPAGVQAHQVLLKVWRTDSTVERSRIKVSVDDTLVGTFEIPIRSSTQQPLPIAVPLNVPKNREVTLTVRHLDETIGGEIHWGDVTFDDKLPSPLVLLDDYGAPAAVNKKDTAKATFTTDDVLSGQRAMKLTPGSRFQLPVGTVLKIREQPGEDAFRYLRFAFRKVGGGTISLELHQPDELLPPIRYDAGAGEPGFGKSNKVWGAGIPDVWVMVEVDLFTDWGESQIDGLVLGTPDGDYALFDYVYLARNRRDFSRIAGVPSLADNNYRARRALIQPILDKTAPAIVAIEVEGRKGTGVLFGDQGHVLTATSVLGGNDRPATVRLSNGKQIKGTTSIAPDSATGFIKLAEKPELPGLALSKKTNLPNIGIYVGYSFTPQTFKNRAGSYLTNLISSDETTLQTNFILNGALPGGPLFDENSNILAMHEEPNPPKPRHFNRVSKAPSQQAAQPPN